MTTNEKTLEKKNLGENIRNERIRKGYTVEAFANEIGVSSRLIYDYEDSFKFPSLDTLIKISLVLEVTIDSILRAA